MYAIRVAATGGPEVLRYEEVQTPVAGSGEALVRLEAVGVNYIDVYHRTGLYKMPLPFTPGSEGAGVVESTGERVAYAMSPGAYAEFAVVPTAKLVPIPEGVDSRTAAAAMLQGMTAHYLVTSVFDLKRGHTALVHAAAGGVGGLLVQMAKSRGARVLATASKEKLDLVRELGADVAIPYDEEDFENVVMRETDGRGANVVYDSVGKTTFEKSVKCVGLRGTLALFGQSSGPVTPFDPAKLAAKCIFLTRPSLGAYTATRDELLWRAKELFEAIRSGALKLRIDRELPLRDAAEAHRLLESRKTAGKLLLIPAG
jgi:NADPH:quinone reductase